MVRAVTEVDDALRMTVDPVRLERVPVGDVPGVSGRCRKVGIHGSGHGWIVERAAQSAVTHTLEALVPVLRQPHFDVDLLVDDRAHPAKGYAHRDADISPEATEHAVRYGPLGRRGNRLDLDDARPRELQPPELPTGSLCGPSGNRQRHAGCERECRQ